VGETEVTRQEWAVLAGQAVGIWCYEASCPVNQLTWWSALGFLNAMSTARGLTPCYTLPTSCFGTWQAGTLDCGNDRQPTVTGGDVYACDGYRLPTEVEWEYAARAGTTTATYGGDLNSLSCPVTLSGAGAFPAGTSLDVLAWTNCPGSQMLQQVRQKAPNAWGLHEVLGSLSEWTWDAYGPTNAPAGTDPQRGTAGAKVLRGGDWTWNTSPGAMRAAFRAYHQMPNTVNYHWIGFRVARTLPPSP